MSKRRDAPALYEVIRTRNERGPMPSRLNYAAPPPPGASVTSAPEGPAPAASRDQSNGAGAPSSGRHESATPASGRSAAPVRHQGQSTYARAGDSHGGITDEVRDPRNWPLIETRNPTMLGRFVGGLLGGTRSDAHAFHHGHEPGNEAAGTTGSGRQALPSGATVAAPGVGSGSLVTDATGAAGAAPLASPTGNGVLGLDRIMRIPVGYVFVAAGLTLVLIVIAYSVGYSRGERLASLGPALPGGGNLVANAPGLSTDGGTVGLDSDREGSSGQRAGLGGSGDRSMTGSTAEGSGRGRPSTSPAGNEANLGNTGGGGAASQPDGGNAAEPADRLRVDTRQGGLNYIKVERFAEDEALAVARFLMVRGIDVMVLPADGAGSNLFVVVTREGFQGWRSNEKAQSTLKQIQRLGREWQADFGGSKNFDAAYGERF